MTRVDRYILFLYLRVLVICFGCVSGLLIVIHAFSNLDELLAFGKQRGNTGLALFEYYGPYSLVLMDRFGGMLALLAVMFVVSWLKRTNELTALMAAGVGPRRILAVPVFASLLFFLGLMLNRELAIPRFEEMLGKNPQDLSVEHLRSVKPVYDAENGILIAGRLLSLANREIKFPSFRLDGPAGQFGKQLEAVCGYYREADENHPAGFLLDKTHIPLSPVDHPSIYFESKPIILSPHDQPWLKSDQAFVVTDSEFEELLGGNAWMQYASTVNMIQRLRAPNSFVSDDLRLNVHQRMVQPMLDVTLLLLGIPILLQRQDKHLFWIAGVTLLTVGLFMLVTKLIHVSSSGTTMIPPYLGAWLPVLLFAPVAYARVQKAWLR
jgi:lipopolysaccharide export system permease protein